MKSVIFLAIALLPLCLAGTMDQHKRNMLKKNKTPKDSILIRGAPISAYEVDEDGTVKLNDACTECKELVKRLDDAIKDPTKMAELKNLLTIFCDTTSYASECKLIVSRLDFILKELQPYLDNPQQFCQKLHICGNARLSQFHRMALVYAKKYMNRVDGVADDLVCDECQFAAMELKKVVEDRSTQTQIQQFISDKICKHLGKLQGTCDEVVEQFLPEFFNELDQMLQNTKQFCTDLGLCQGETVEVEAQPMSPARRTGANSVDHSRLPRPQPLRLKSSWELLKKLQTKKGIKMTCLECEVAVDALIAELETDGALDPAADDVRSLICDHIFPEAWQAGCDDFMRIYLKSALYMTVAVAKSRKICEMMHACTPQASRQIARLTKAEKESEMCEACKGVTSFLRNELRDATFKTDVEDELENYVCAQLPDSAKSVCQNIVETYTPMLLDKLATLVNDEAICKNELHMCTEAEDSEDV